MKSSLTRCSTTANSSTLEREYRGATALNNIGVELLQRNCFEEAYETLQDSSRVMRRLVAAKESSITKAADHRKNDIVARETLACQSFLLPGIDTLLHLAARRSASKSRPKSPTTTMTKSSSTVAIPQTDLIEIISDDWAAMKTNATAILLGNASEPLGTQFFFPIRVEVNNDVSASDALASNECHLRCAIIIHNVAIAAACLGRSQLAYQLLELAYSLLQRQLINAPTQSGQVSSAPHTSHIDAASVASHNQTINQQQRLFFLGLIVLRSILQVLQATIRVPGTAGNPNFSSTDTRRCTRRRPCDGNSGCVRQRAPSYIMNHARLQQQLQLGIRDLRRMSAQWRKMIQLFEAAKPAAPVA